MSLPPIDATDISATDAEGIFSNFEWRNDSVTFGFSDSADDYPEIYSANNEQNNGYHAVSAVGRAYMRDAFLEIGQYTALSIGEASDLSDADMVIGGSATPSVALAYSPGFSSAAGDIWFNLNGQYLGDLTSPDETLAGSYAWVVVLHEFGHALGLKHGHESTRFNPLSLPTEFDGVEYSVMTYRSYVGDTTTNGYNVYEGNYPQSLMIMDIAALQSLYGADYSTLSDDTTYSFDPSSGTMLINGEIAQETYSNKVFRTLWDGGGTDYLDLSNYSNDLAIDLRPGQGTDLDVGGNDQRARLASNVYAPSHIYQSLLHDDNPASLIENASGGSGDDILVGNDAANRLSGGGGTNVLFGGAGADVFAGTAEDLAGDEIVDFATGDTIEIETETSDFALETTFSNETSFVVGDLDGILLGGTAAFGLLSVASNAEIMEITAGTDSTVLLSDQSESFVGSGETGLVVDAHAGDDVIIGTEGNDTLLGGTGSDSIIGLNGNDRIVGGQGPDILAGGAGADTFVISASDVTGSFSIDTILDFDVTEDLLELQGFASVDLSDTTETENGTAVVLGGGAAVIFENLSPSDIAQITVYAANNTQTLASRDPARYLTNTDDTWLLGDTNDAFEIFALDGDDIVLTGSGDDTLSGGQGFDKLIGGGGADTINGGDGSDEYVGDSGADVFVFTPDSGTSLIVDVIADLSLVEDQILLDGFGFTDVSQINMTSVDSGTALVLNASHAIILEGITDQTALTASAVFEFG